MVLVQPTRERILISGSNLLSQAGLNGLTLGVLAEKAGLSKSGLFAHFRNKDDLQIQMLEHTAQIAKQQIVAPALLAREGLPRLRAVVERWMGWTRYAGLEGGCALAAGMFDLDDQTGPVRDKLLQLEEFWRRFLIELTHHAVQLGHLRSDLDVEQFVWELCGIYLSHHASFRFLRDPQADARAAFAFEALLERALPVKTTRARKRKKT